MTIHIDTSTVIAISGALTAIAVLFQKALISAIDAFAFRAHWFFRSRLTDLTMSREHLQQDLAIRNMIERRVFAFLFGIYADRNLRDRIFKALADDELTEHKVKACGSKLRVDAAGLLTVAPSKFERIELTTSYVFSALSFVGTVAFLSMLIDRRNENIGIVAKIILIVLAFVFISAMFFQLRNIIAVKTTVTTRKELERRQVQ